MSQDWTDNSFQTDHDYDTDMGNIEANMDALKTTFLGASAPPSPVAGLPWHDSANGLLKHYYASSWVTIFDLANSRALAALNATNAANCSRSVLAGTGMSGGGALTGNVTLNHAAHTGDVTGSTALTIGANAVKASNLSHGLGTVWLKATQETEDHHNGTSWTARYDSKILMPSGPTAIRLYAEIKSSGSGTTAYARIGVGSVQRSSGGGRTSTSYGWVDCGTVDVSGLTPGTVYDISVQTYISSTHEVYLAGFAAWWE